LNEANTIYIFLEYIWISKLLSNLYFIGSQNVWWYTGGHWGPKRIAGRL